MDLVLLHGADEYVFEVGDETGEGFDMAAVEQGPEQIVGLLPVFELDQEIFFQRVDGGDPFEARQIVRLRRPC